MKKHIVMKAYQFILIEAPCIIIDFLNIFIDRSFGHIHARLVSYNNINWKLNGFSLVAAEKAT